MLEELQQSSGKVNATLYKTGNYRGDRKPFTGCLQIPCSFKYCELKSPTKSGPVSVLSDISEANILLFVL